MIIIDGMIIIVILILIIIAFYIMFCKIKNLRKDINILKKVMKINHWDDRND